ncbi:MAG: DUF3368 domain-containing protein [Candidatus Thermoplasmatota archaeon]
MRVVADASPLIYLAKVGKISLLRDLFGRVAIPREVFAEAVVRAQGEFPEAAQIETAIDEGWLEVCDVLFDKKLLNLVTELDKGEIEVIALSKKTDADLTLMDDAVGRRVAESFGLNVKGTLYVILCAFKRGILSKKDTMRTIQKLVVAGFRLSSEIYGALVSELEKNRECAGTGG